MNWKALRSILNYLDQASSISSQDFGVNISNLPCQMCLTRLPLYHASMSQFWQNAMIVFQQQIKIITNAIMFNEAFTTEKIWRLCIFVQDCIDLSFSMAVHLHKFIYQRELFKGKNILNSGWRFICHQPLVRPEVVLNRGRVCVPLEKADSGSTIFWYKSL